MQKVKSIFLLILMGVLLFPWQAACFTHPFGHDHHDKEPGPCEMRKLYQEDGPAIFPPMHCEFAQVEFDDYQSSHFDQVKPAVQPLLFATAVIEFILFPKFEPAFIQPPEPKNKSGPLRPVNALRGPPLA